MKYRFDGYNWLVRLEKGELLVNSLTILIREEKIKGGWISGIGGAQWAELHFYDLPAKQYHWKRIDHLLEINTIQGVIAWKGKDPSLHIHGVFSGPEMQTYGGHIKEAEIAATCEIMIHKWYQDGLSRTFSDEVGLELLEL